MSLLRKLLLLFGLMGLGSFSSEACIPQINWADTLVFCQGNTFTLSAYNPNCNYLWSTGDTTSSLAITASGVYWVAVTNNCGTTRDTVHVQVDSPIFPNLGPDRLMCSGGNTLLSVPRGPNSSFIWQDGSTANSFPVSSSGLYYVSVTNSCGTFSDSVNITYRQTPLVNLGPDQNYCGPFSSQLSVTANPSATVLWSTGATSNSINVSTPGTYWVEMSNSCGIDRDSIRLTVQQGGQLNIGDTAFKCINGFATLTANVAGGSYLWSTGATTASIAAGQTGIYWLRYTDSCGVYYDSTVVVSSPPAVADLGADRDICANSSVTLDAGNPGSAYQWSGGSKGRFKTVSDSGLVWLGVNNGCGWDYDTIQVTLRPVPDPKIADTVFYCYGQSVSVDAGYWGNSSSYLWSNGASSQNQSFSSDGNYWVQARNDCDTVLVPFTVQGVNSFSFSLGPDTIVCDNAYLINSNLNSAQFDLQWSTGSDLPSISVSQPGTYWLMATNACGTQWDTVEVSFQSEPLPPAARQVKACQGGVVQIGAAPVPNTTYLWSTGDTTSQISVSQGGMYYFTAHNLCDTIYDSVDVDQVQAINVNLGRDTSFCEPATYYLNVGGMGADSIFWSTGSRNGGLPITKSGTYWVKLYNACGVFSDTVTVTIDRLPKAQLRDQVICSGGNTVLDVSQSQKLSYLWSTGDTTSSITVSQAGWYYVDMTSVCGSLRDSAYVRVEQPLPTVYLGNDTIFCQGTLVLDPGAFPYAKYKWQDGSSKQNYTVTTSGHYYVSISNSCNTVSDSIFVLITGPPKLVLGTTIKFCSGSTLMLNAQNPGSSYLWNTGDTTQSILINQGGRYWVTMSNNCGMLTDTVDVVVEDPMPDVDLGADTLICRGTVLTLQPQYDQVRYLWNTGETSLSIRVDTTGLYWVRVRNSCGSWFDSIYVYVQDIPTFDLGEEAYVCQDGGFLQLAAPKGMNSYRWSTGDTLTQLEITQPGIYWLTVRNDCFSYTDTIRVIGEQPIDLDLGADTTLCFGEILTLSPGSFPYLIRWNDGLVQPTREVTRGGRYWVRASNSCGVFFDTIRVRFDRPIEEGVWDTLACAGETTLIDLRGIGDSVYWYDGSRDSVRNLEEEGLYGLSITNSCGTFSKIIDLQFTNCDCPVFIPNAFTPNGDGVNDYYRVGYDCLLAEYQIEIFDRWGQLVYLGQNEEAGWDGMIGGRPASLGSYNYRIIYKWQAKGVKRERVRRGILHLLR